MIKIDGTWFKDELGRSLLLRGVNLGGSSKLPYRPYLPTHVRDGFFDHRYVSFVGRPFPLEEADEHFKRLQRWGLTLLRLLVPWEAVEHAGPGIYDQEYLDYLVELVRKAGDYGFRLFIDPHQDAWSRFSGGDGAPGWTFEAIGMDMTRFSETGAAIVHAIHGDPFPPMIWPTNYSKLAAATMFTLFFGGNDFAPHTLVGNVPVQEFLQSHYCNTFRQVALRLRDFPHVIGYDTLNEPSAGFIGRTNLNDSASLLRLGDSPTPYQAMLLGAGWPQEVEVWELGFLGFQKNGRKLLNPAGTSVWRDGCPCIWQVNGVWDLDAAGRPQLQRPHHFASVNGHPVEFGRDYLTPFANRFAREIRSVHADAVIFVENEATHPPPFWTPEDAPNVVSAPHWYDGFTLFTRRFVPWLGVDFRYGTLIMGQRQVRRAFVRQLADIKHAATERMGGVPTLIGETGIPFDMNDKNAYRTANFTPQVRALDTISRALEANLLSYTLWNYTADNDNVHGDQWNGEDLSIFSRDQQVDPEDLDSGGRALPAVVRPYARATAGEPLFMRFDLKKRIFKFKFHHDAALNGQASTEIFVPHFHYPGGYKVTVSDGSYEIDEANQTLIYRHSLEREVHTITISRNNT